jgi:hypothetical protein
MFFNQSTREDKFMIKQLKVTSKSGSAALTYAEMGDIVVSATATITLPTPSNGLWYRVSNVSSGTVSIYYGTTLTTLEQYEQVLCLANGSSAWWFSKGGGGVTSHSDLADLDADDHQQYLNEDRHGILDHAGLQGIPAAEAFTELVHAQTNHTGLPGIPTPEAFSLGGYEVKTASSSKLDPSAGDLLVAEVDRLIKRI